MTISSPDDPNLYDPRQGRAAVRLDAFTGGPGAVEPSRTNYFTIYHVGTGEGVFCADAARHPFAAGWLLFFTPYQYIRLAPQGTVAGDVVQFHANFLCVETFHAESGCAGVLFNDPYRPPVVRLNRQRGREIGGLLRRMRREQQGRALGFEDMLLAQLKMLLILATRCKGEAVDADAGEPSKQRHPVLGPLKELLEANYQVMHAPSDYARRLHMSPKTLGRVVREQLGTSLTDLIRQRILTHAKWQLLHTLKPVKEIAHEVGFGDELYFSRMFKKATGHSPTFFREFETKIRGGSNLSMSSFPAPIRGGRTAVDNPRG